MSDIETYPDGVTLSHHIAHDMRHGRFPSRSGLATFLAEREEELRGYNFQVEYDAGRGVSTVLPHPDRTNPEADYTATLHAEILSLRQQVEKARAQGRDEGLEEAAKVADPTLIECECCRDTRIAIATAIRALKSGEGV